MTNLIRIAATIFLSLYLVSCSSTESTLSDDSNRQQLTVSEIERPIPYPVDMPDAYLAALENGTRSIDGTPGPNYWQNEGSYNLYATLNPDDHTITGRAEITYFNNSPDNLDILVIELAQNLHKEGTPKKDITEITGGKTICLIKVNGEVLEEITIEERWFQNASGFIPDGTNLYLFPDQPVASGNSAELEIEWSFEVPREGASGRMGRSRDNLYMIAYWYPQIAVYDDVFGWMTDYFPGNAEFYHKFSDYTLTVKAPENWIVMGTGEFLNPEETLSERTLDRYRQAGESDDPVVIVDFDEVDNATARSENGMLSWKFSAERVRDVAFSATRQSKWEGARTPVGDLTGDGNTDYTRINTFYRETAPLWSEQTDYAQHSVTFLSDYIDIPYPWPHMTSVEGADIIGGGMEFPMITLIGDYNNAGPVRLYGVTAHEIAHMWYPMIISTNERRYTWIDEGYTTYHTQQANIDYWSSDQFTNSDLFSQYLGIAGTDLEGEIMRWSDFHYPGPAYGVASYPKPGSVLTALRGLLGEDLFREAHLEIGHRWEYKHPYPWDLFNTIEDVTGKDLSWFWRSWFYETWVLNHSIEDVTQNGRQVTVQITDLGDVIMPVIIRATMDDGSTKTHTISVERWLQGFRTADWSFTTESQVVEVEIDPDTLFPDADRSVNIWNR